MDLRLENVTKRFGNKLAVEIPSLTIHRGEFFTFVGPSGCGKSTTLNLIAGLEQPTGGTLQLGSRNLNPLSPHKRDVAFVFQSYALYPHRTVFRNLSFPLELAGTPGPVVKEQVEETAALLGLDPLLQKYPRQLSGGERQRVALGRAIIRHPQLFLFDEPLSNLDAPLRAQMRIELKRLHRKLDTTFIYVTHDQEEALSLSDRIAVMREGKVLQCGTPEEVYEKPANTFVASFFGSPPITLLRAALATGAGSAWLRVADRRLRVRGLDPQILEAGTVQVGIRPEHVSVSRDNVPEGWRVQVVMAERHGGQRYLELDAGDFRLRALTPAESNLRAGENAWACIPFQRSHLFDAKTGERLPSAVIETL